ncbi:MAG: FeoB small GTPase domain-containing protein, partial [Polyangiales bacterium]
MPSRRTRRVLLVGNPNVGKSVLFGKLTATYVTVSNYPGTTVEVTRGAGVGFDEAPSIDWEIVDTPGTNNLAAMSDDEAVTRAIVLSGESDLVVQVGDAKALSRVLLLTFQLAEAGRPFVLCLN